LSRYPPSKKIFYDNGLIQITFCGLKRKPTMIKIPHANVILECVHQELMYMLRPAELDMAEKISEEDVSNLLDDTS